MDAPVPVLRNAALALKPQGLIGIIDFSEGEGGPGPNPEERVAPAVILQAAAAAGLRLDRREMFLPYQYFLIFNK
jgi:hypothetical protein